MEAEDDDVKSKIEDDEVASPSTNKDSVERNGQTPLVNRRANRSMLTAKSSAYLQPGRALDLFCEPPMQMLWDEKPLWTPTKMFMDGDDSSKVLLMDMRSSLITSRMSTHSSQSLPSIEPLNDCLAQMPTVQKVAFNETDFKILSRKEERNTKCRVPLMLLKRPSNAKAKLHLNDVKSEKAEEEVLLKLERFCKSGDITVFEKALEQCMRSVRLVYYTVLELMTHPDDRRLEPKDSIIVQFAQSLERAYLDDQRRRETPKDSCVDPDAIDFSNLTVKHRRCGRKTKPDHIVASNIVLLKRITDPLPEDRSADRMDANDNIDKTDANDNIDNTANKEDIYRRAYNMLLEQTRKHHAEFFAKLCAQLRGSDPNLILRRDFSGSYKKLIQFDGCKQISADNMNGFNFIRPFLCHEFISLSKVERIASRTFKLETGAVANPADIYLVGAKLDMANVYLAKAAIVDLNNALPFEELSFISLDTSYLYALCAFIRDDSHHWAISEELKSLSKLYVKFFATFTLIYDAIFNQNCRRGNPYKRMKNQRWLFPDGVKDPLYDPDPAKRICNNLPRFVNEEWLPTFKYYHYWAGLRLLTFIGYKIIEMLDLDNFDEQVQVALYGLSVGLSSGIMDRIHLLQLSKFLIAVTTVCEQKQSSDPEQRSYRTACRLLVEFFALLLQNFNKYFSSSSLLEVLKSHSFTDEMMAYLMPITLLSYWMANSPLFFKYEAWNRKWSFSIAFTADFWPELSTLANGLRLLKNNGFYNGISMSDATDESAGEIIPELANSFGISPVFNAFPKCFIAENKKVKTLNKDVVFRLFSIWENVQSIATHDRYFVYQDKKGFVGESDEKRFLVPEPDYFDTPKLLPVPLNEIEDCIRNITKEIEEEQKRELENLIELAKSEARNQHSILHDKILIIVRPRYLVIDTNTFIDGLDVVLSLLEDPFFTILVPVEVIGELRGLQKKKSASPSNQDEEHAKQVSEAAVRSLQVLESIKRDNLKLLVRGGRTLKMDINYKYFSAEIKTNNDRLIIESAKEFSEKVCPKGIRLPRGDLWVFREVCLLTRDRIMMLLANAYRLPSLDCDSFADWAGFQCKEQC